MISEHKRNTVKGVLLGLAFVMLFSSCTLSDAKSNNTRIGEETAIIQPEQVGFGSIVLYEVLDYIGKKTT
ncbi:hypothetical protein [Paenibacillus sp. ISL-20]|uniref:hypothetical protein n=1 Tax=Paenibacillus sp. ISL-20 TaxID=2819163 RepID=UPI001BE57E1F|nr:hypothetical protein [Paenibacillus sp. ISL-20]MBT2764257.1 hypothetical protein [Paenibacillus sp. ISL-20]